jgi:hypothetical protein
MRSEPSTRKSTVAVYLIAVRVKISTIEFAATEPRPFVWPTLKNYDAVALLLQHP